MEPGSAVETAAQPPASTLDKDRRRAGQPARPELTVDSRRDPELDQEDDEFDGGPDDAQSLFQPAISPIATRLALPKTPAAEKAAAMDKALNGFFAPFPHVPDMTVSSPSPVQPGPATTPFPQLQTPSRLDPAGAGPAGRQSTLAGVFGGSRHRRASSVGSDTLKRLSKALPSISLPSGLFPSLPTPSFLSSSGSSSAAASTNRHGGPRRAPTALLEMPNTPAQGQSGAAKPKDKEFSQAPAQTQAQIHFAPECGADVSGQALPHTSGAARQQRPPSVMSVRSHKLRRSTSAESVLFTTLSRVSSFGDDDRFDKVREQVNSRFKAIMDSFDRPTFKMPQLPNLMSSAPFIKGPSPSDGTLTRNSRAPSVPSPASTAGTDGLAMLDAVLATMTGDVVVLGGYRGSVLRSSLPPNQQLWVPMKVGLNIRKVNLEVGLDLEDEESMESKIFASAMLQNIGPVDISRRLLRRMRESPNARAGTLRVHEFAYDWRLSPARSSRRIIRFLESLKCNMADTPGAQRGALVLAHSLGGIITRHAMNQRPELFSGVGYIGVPQRCINILGPLRNGDAVLLNEKVLTANVTFSFRTSFVFLPEDGFCFMSKDMKESYKIDFYDADEWVRHKLCPAVDPSAQALKTASKRPSALDSLRDLTSSLSTTLPLRGRSASDAPSSRKPFAEITKDRTLAPQMDSPSAADSARARGGDRAGSAELAAEDQFAKSYAYLKRTLAETKQFRAETQHIPALSESNLYPPMAVMYGKDTPTVYAVRVASRETIMGPEVYDDLVFRSGDGVVLAREAMLPPGFNVVRGGRVSTDKGHISMLGDSAAVARVLESLIRGRKKGIGLGKSPHSQQKS